MTCRIGHRLCRHSIAGQLVTMSSLAISAPTCKSTAATTGLVGIVVVFAGRFWTWLVPNNTRRRLLPARAQ